MRGHVRGGDVGLNRAGWGFLLMNVILIKRHLTFHLMLAFFVFLLVKRGVFHVICIVVRYYSVA